MGGRYKKRKDYRIEVCKTNFFKIFPRKNHSPIILELVQMIVKAILVTIYYLPTPPLGQDMTQGQFLSGV